MIQVTCTMSNGNTFISGIFYDTFEAQFFINKAQKNHPNWVYRISK